MANVPNTTTSGQVLTSVGDGSNASKWGTVTSGGSSGITQLTGDVTAGPGSGSVSATVVKIQGKTVSTTAPSADGQLLVWNNSTSQWVPVSPSTDLALAASGTATVKGLNQQPLPLSPASTGGEVLYYSTLAGAWRYGGLQSAGTSPTVNQVLTWSTSQGWIAVTPTGGGGLGNNDAGNIYLSTAQSQPISTQNYPVNAAGGAYSTNYSPKGAMTVNTTGVNAGLVVGTAGIYHVTAQIAITPGVAFTQLQCQIIANGSQVATSQAGAVASGANEFLQASCDVSLAVGNIIQMAWYFSSGTAGNRTLTTGGSYTFLSAHLIST